MVVCCCYSQTNAPGRGVRPAARSPLKHELAEMALVDVPPVLQDLGITVMDGPFFSCMPFPPRGLHTLSHVRYTPHGHWYDGRRGRTAPPTRSSRPRRSATAFPHMVRDAARYLPALARCEYRDSLWEVKTVLPRSESGRFAADPVPAAPRHARTTTS